MIFFIDIEIATPAITLIRITAAFLLRCHASFRYFATPHLRAEAAYAI